MSSRRASLNAVWTMFLVCMLSAPLWVAGCRPGSRSVAPPSSPPHAAESPPGSTSDAESSHVSDSQRPDVEGMDPIEDPLMPPVLVDVEGVQDVDGGQRTVEQPPKDAPSSEPKFQDQLASSDEPGSADTPVESAADVSGDDSGEDVGEPPAYTSWDPPAVTLVVTGQQNGYLEPCGCTGLDRQKGGVARRYTLLEQLRSRGWELVPIDAGNQVRRYGRQAEIKYHRSLEALREMGYVAVGFGPDDIRLSVGDLIQEAAAESEDEALHLSANVVLFDPTLMPKVKTVEAGGLTIGVTSILHPASLKADPSGEIEIGAAVDAARAAIAEIRQRDADFTVTMFYGDESAADSLAREVPGIDLLVVSGSDGEPLYRPREIEGSRNRDGGPTKLIVTGNKGMYAGLVGIEPDRSIRYARVALTHEFKDAPQMRQLMADYQQQLKEVGLDGLGLRPLRHPTGEKFVGSSTCGECHTLAFDIWSSTPHALATDHVVEPPKDRGDVARHFDPECLSCHVTGWHPQDYQPYESGYLSLEADSHLTGNGCENCHGPGGSHVAAEQGDLDVPDDRLEELRVAMRLPLERARDRCLECHDLDNSPDFHEPDAFEDIYWPEVEHYGLD